MDFNIYVIHSTSPLATLRDHLDKAGGYKYAGIIYKSIQRRDRGKLYTEKEETRKTLVFCPESTITRLKELYPNYKDAVAEYDWSSFVHPTASDTWSLHVSNMPKDFTIQDAEAFIEQRIGFVLPRRDGDKTNYVVDFAPRLRETGEIYGHGSIRFEPHVDKQLIKMCKLVLHNTPVCHKTDSRQRKILSCTWSKASKQVEVLPSV